MSHHRGTFPPTLDAFPRVAAFLEEVCAAAAFGRDDSLRLTLVVEELFTNTVMHGLPDGAPIELVLEALPGHIAVTYEDLGPPFDPFAARELPTEADDIEHLPVGGLGLVLIVRLSEDLHYTHTDGRNRISLVMRSPR